jgi:hypothetical protein
MLRWKEADERTEEKADEEKAQKNLEGGLNGNNSRCSYRNNWLADNHF